MHSFRDAFMGFHYHTRLIILYTSHCKLSVAATPGLLIKKWPVAVCKTTIVLCVFLLIVSLPVLNFHFTWSHYLLCLLPVTSSDLESLKWDPHTHIFPATWLDVSYHIISYTFCLMMLICLSKRSLHLAFRTKLLKRIPVTRFPLIWLLLHFIPEERVYYSYLQVLMCVHTKSIL